MQPRFSPDGKRLASAGQTVTSSGPTPHPQGRHLGEGEAASPGSPSAPTANSSRPPGSTSRSSSPGHRKANPQTYLHLSCIAGVTASRTASTSRRSAWMNRWVWKADTGENPPLKGRHPRHHRRQFSPEWPASPPPVGTGPSSSGTRPPARNWHAAKGMAAKYSASASAPMDSVSRRRAGLHVSCGRCNRAGDQTLRMTQGDRQRRVPSGRQQKSRVRRLEQVGQGVNVNTGRRAGSRQAHATRAAASPSPDGQHVASTGQDGRSSWDASAAGAANQDQGTRRRGHELAFNLMALAARLREGQDRRHLGRRGLEVKPQADRQEESSDITRRVVQSRRPTSRLGRPQWHGQDLAVASAKELLAVQAHSDGIPAWRTVPTASSSVGRGTARSPCGSRGQGSNRRLQGTRQGHGRVVQSRRQSPRVGQQDGAVAHGTGTDQELKTFHGHGGLVTSVAFSPDGTPWRRRSPARRSRSLTSRPDHC